MVEAKTDPTRIDDPSKAASGWVLIVEHVFPMWRDRLRSAKDARDALDALLCDPETRSKKQRVNATGEEIPGTFIFPDSWFWRNIARLELEPDADGGADHIVVVHVDHADVYLPDGRWEFYVRRLDVERWERLYFPMTAAPPSAAQSAPDQQSEDKVGLDPVEAKADASFSAERPVQESSKGEDEDGWQVKHVKEALEKTFPPDGRPPLDLSRKDILKRIKPIFEAQGWKFASPESVGRALRSMGHRA
jgi:hypothetical protein